MTTIARTKRGEGSFAEADPVFCSASPDLERETILSGSDTETEDELEEWPKRFKNEEERGGREKE